MLIVGLSNKVKEGAENISDYSVLIRNIKKLQKRVREFTDISDDLVVFPLSTFRNIDNITVLADVPNEDSKELSNSRYQSRINMSEYFPKEDQTELIEEKIKESNKEIDLCTKLLCESEQKMKNEGVNIKVKYLKTSANEDAVKTIIESNQQKMI